MLFRKKKKEEEHSNEWIEIEAKSKDDAIERACAALNTTQAYLEYETLNNSGNKIRARKTLNKVNNVEEKVEPSEHELEESDSNGNVSDNQEADDEKEEVAQTELGEKSKTVMLDILKFFGEGNNVDLTETKDEIYLDILGDSSGLFIGKHGQTLEAFQHVIAKMLGLDRNSQKRLVLDAEGYRSRRQDSLQNLARRLAQKAKRERRPVSLEPMSAMDRRVIHMTLANDRYVSTKSVGEGLNRKIVVVPKNTSRDRGARDDRNDRNDRNERNNRNSFRSGQGRQHRSTSATLVGRSSRMHDSFDVPPVPKMKAIPEDIDDLMNLSDKEMHERLASYENKSKGSDEE